MDNLGELVLRFQGAISEEMRGNQLVHLVPPSLYCQEIMLAIETWTDYSTEEYC